jgi:hypothetical protein
MVFYGGVERGQQRLFIIDELDYQKFKDSNGEETFGRLPECLKVTKQGVVWALNEAGEEEVIDAKKSDEVVKKRKSRSKLVVREPRSCDFVFAESASELIPRGKHMAVHDGDRVKSGEKLCEGSVDPHDILRVSGPEAVQEYLVNEIQAVYRLQGVSISDKHIECIVRQMLRKVRVSTPGDADYLENEEVTKTKIRVVNIDLEKEGKELAKYDPMLLGITRASLATDSFISAASFQETTKVLTRAAVEGKSDELVGLKENVIMGRLIPSGTGSPHLRDMRVTDLDAVEAMAKEPEQELEVEELVEAED